MPTNGNATKPKPKNGNGGKAKKGGKPRPAAKPAAKAGVPAKAAAKVPAKPPARVEVPRPLQELVRGNVSVTPKLLQAAEKFVVANFGQQAWDLQNRLRALDIADSQSVISGYWQRGRLFKEAHDKYGGQCFDVVASTLGCGRSYAYDMMKFHKKTPKETLSQVTVAIADGRLPVEFFNFKKLRRLMVLTDPEYVEVLNKLASGAKTVNEVMLQIQGREKTREGREPAVPKDLASCILGLDAVNTKYSRYVSKTLEQSEELRRQAEAVQDEEAAVKLVERMDRLFGGYDELGRALSTGVSFLQQIREELADRFGIPAPGAPALEAPEDDDEEDDEDEETAELDDDEEDEEEDDEDEDEEEDDSEDGSEDDESDDDESESDEDDESDGDDEETYEAPRRRRR